MADELLTSDGMLLLQKVIPDLKRAILAFNELRFDEGKRIIADVDGSLSMTRHDLDDDEAVLNDLYVLGRFVKLIERYGLLWDTIVARQFSASWSYVQDVLDLLRLIKRFSSLDVSFFENQILELEEAYPYNVFFSIGATVRYFECSICGRDIDSDQCLHVKGQLYRGEMAYGIAREMGHLDHISAVPNPDDKRCVVVYEDTAQQFALIRYISELVSSRKLRPLEFDRVDWSKRKHRNPAFAALGRNERCACGSGRKFKHCCIAKKEVEVDHAEVISHQRGINDAIILSR